MNGVAHYVVGLLITLAIVQSMSSDDTTADFSITNVSLIILIAFFSHMVVDAIAYFTYHPSESDWGDPVYAGWHLLTYIAEAVFAIYFLRTDIRYSFGMLASVGFDLWDWSIRRPLLNYAGLELPGIHWLADGTQKLLFEWWAPSLRYNQWALIVEVILVTVGLVYWKRWHNNSAMSLENRPGTWLQITILVLVFGTLRLLTLV